MTDSRDLEKASNSSGSGSVNDHEEAAPKARRFGFFSKKSGDAKPPKAPGPLAKVEDKLDYSNVPPSQVDLLKTQVAMPPHKGGIPALYRFATPTDWILLIIGWFFAMIHGVSLPMITLVLGAFINSFRGFLVGSEFTDAQAFQHRIDHNALYFVYIGVSIIVSSFLESAILVNMGERLSSRYRKAYLKATLHQNIAYFDNLGSGEVTTRITNDTMAIQEAISEKSGNIISGVAAFVTAIVIGLAVQWKLSLILISGVFFIVFNMVFFSRLMVKHMVVAESTYARGSSIPEEAFSSIRNTIAFGIQTKLAEKFDSFLKISRASNYRKNMFQGLMIGCLWGGVFWLYSLAFWEGSRLIVKGEISIGHIMNVVVAMIMGSFQVSLVAPNIPFIVKGVAAAASINETIDRDPVIGGSSDLGGKTLPNLVGKIEFKNIQFRYPSRPDVEILPDFNLSIEPDKTVALVGASGSGKSTVIGILERFYLPLAGSVTLDGVELAELDLNWLRQSIGYVSQEPTLFAVSIYENISYGLVGTEFEHAPEEVKREKVIEACKLANAWDFIQQLSEKLETDVGDRGFLLSGGQKQRIAIARAIVSNPKILLLDEATSALDTKSEGIVQEALDRASKSRTTIVIAHRLSTIKDADKIVVMAKGRILEQGNHRELMDLGGTYAQLVEAQALSKKLNNKESVSTEDSAAASDDEAPQQLEIHEDKFVEEDDALVKTGTRASRVMSITPEKNIAGMQKPNTTFKGVVAMLWKINVKERKQIILGAISAVFLGMGFPSLAMLVGHSVKAIIVPPSQYPEMRHHLNLYTGMLFMVGWEHIITAFLMISLLTYATENLLRNVRLNMFRQLMRMDVAFFDHADNSPGALTSMLGKDGKAIEGLGGATFGQILNSITMLVAGIIVAISFAWKLGLVGFACVPILVASGFLRARILMRMQARARGVYERSASLASQFASAVRTVQTLTREKGVQETYDKVIDSQIRESTISITKSALFYGLSEGTNPLVFSLIFWYGSSMIRKHEIGVLNYMVVFISIIIGSQGAGYVFSNTPDLGKAKSAASNVYRVLDAVPTIDTWSQDGTPLGRDAVVEGDIAFTDVVFRYPTRPLVPVLKGISFTAKPGQFVALVGPSGSGKSTTIGLIERFYNPQKGHVLLDGRDISEYNINDYRSHISLVQQEPMLYSGTVKENVVYGWNGPDDSEVTDEMIHDACKRANIHDFIMSLSQGYDTPVGSRGGMLSGGQKQRVAIARALIRNPKVLLLDEATSALDSESEKVVQAALDTAAKGRTTIAIAHRLSTVKNADMIHVLDGGRIVESGNHQELLELGGIYAELVRLQSLEQ